MNTTGNTPSEKAIACFDEGFSCSQSVLCAFSDQFNLDRTTALKLADSFGGGMGRLGLTCGAVTGALMVIGLKYGREKADDKESKQKTVATVREFIRKFQACHGSIACRDLLGVDLSTGEGFAAAHDRKIIKTRCPVFIADAVRILEEILSEP